MITFEGCKEVTKEEFFNTLHTDKRDIMPSVSDSDEYTVWRHQAKTVFGYTLPGWKYPQEEKKYFLIK